MTVTDTKLYSAYLMYSSKTLLLSVIIATMVVHVLALKQQQDALVQLEYMYHKDQVHDERPEEDE